jgi:protease I
MAVLAASGLHENDLIETQKAVQKTGIKLQIISMDQGLLSSWNESGWGLSFAVDGLLNQALAADYAGLLIPGGRRSIDKLKMTAHTKRFIGGFLDHGKPVIAMDEAAELLAFSEKITGRTVSAPDAAKTQVESAGATWSSSMVEIDSNLMTINRGHDTKAVLTPMIADFLGSSFALKKAA